MAPPDLHHAKTAFSFQEEPSQPVLNHIEVLREPSQRSSKPTHRDQAFVLAGVSTAGQEAGPKSSSNHAESAPGNPLSQNAVNWTTARKDFPGASASQLGKMSSGDTASGDTQVVSQSVYDSIMKQNNNTSAYDGLESIGDGGTLKTLHEGDTGHIDLLAGFGGDTHPDLIHQDDNEDRSSSKLGESSPVRYQSNLFPESQRFLMTTPATGLAKRHINGQATETPGLQRNPLAADAESSGGIMGLSQVFKATQAPSSPLAAGRRSDPMSDRPSPNIPLQIRPLAGALSSPFMSGPAKLQRNSSEPHYISMEESQAERDRLRGQRMTRSAEDINSDDQSDGEFDNEPSFVRRLRRQRTIDEEAAAQFAGLTAPARPTSRRSGKRDGKPVSPQAAPERGDWGQSTGAPAPDHEMQDHDGHQHGGTSEEETEQEEDIVEPIPVFAPNSSEEDKENYNDPSASSLTGAANAHDRLSQALALPENQAHAGPSSQDHHVNPYQCSRSPNRDDQADEISRSSQGFIVKDSQQSPRRKDDVNHDNGIENKEWDHSTPRARPNMGTEPPLGSEKVLSSPVSEQAMQSSPPSSTPQRNSPSNSRQAQNPEMPAPSQPASSRDTSNQHSKGASVHLSQASSSRASQRAVDFGQSSRVKSSSMPSHIAETPLHHQSGSSRNMNAAPSVPESSPRLQRQDWANEDLGDAQNQEDDDLPPMHSSHERTSQSRLFNAQQSLLPPRSAANTKILSSPSGRQRRALTEIAADASPQVGNNQFEIDLGIFTADDKEFNSLAMSPIQPKKKRRGNDGQNICASDPVLPFTPRPTTRVADAQRDEPIPEAPEPEAVAESEIVTAAIPHAQSKPTRQAESVWDVDTSPQFKVSRLKNRRKRDISRNRERPTRPRRNERNSVTPWVVIHNSRNDDSAIQAGTPEPPAPDTPAATADVDVKIPFDGVKIALDQVMALWPGQKRAYHPGTCFGTPVGTAPSRYVVKLEDSVPVEVPLAGVKRLEFCIGDAVKADMPNVPKITHIVRGFGDKLSVEELSKQNAMGLSPMTDVYGHSSLVLGPKQRKSLPGGGLTGPDNLITVPIAKIYMDTMLWNRFKDRSYTYTPEGAPSESRVGTPSERNATPTSPSARLSRSIHPSTGLFAGMVFAVSYMENEDAKSRVTKSILENGGRIVRDGFNELFEFPSNVPLATPSATPASSAADPSQTFRLTGPAKDVGFACLIADKHSRREKYMQALALNLPCLSGRWIEDSVAQGQVLDWDMYLLPAGESMYLDGATKSRVLAPTPPTTARLCDTIAGRPNLLHGQSVLLVMGRGRADERKKAYIFLTYALGAGKVERVFDLKSAKGVLDRQPEWDWVYVDDDEQAAARSLIHGASTNPPQKSRGRKRKRTSSRVGAVEGTGSEAHSHVKIVGNEFVCQSLILGRLFE